MTNENSYLNIIEKYSCLELLYVYGNETIDNIVEKEYPGEDVFVSFYSDGEKLNLIINEQCVTLEIKNISKIQLLYDDGQIAVNYCSDEYLFSYGHRISLELLSLLFDLNVTLDIPEFLFSRFQQMKDKELFSIVEKHRQEIPFNDYVHFYNEIDEMEYCGIIESFTSQALSEAPILYIKYLNSDTKENGLLVTAKKIYSLENSININEIHSIRFEEQFNVVDTIHCFVNEKLFTSMKLIVWDRSIANISGLYKREFYTEDIFKLIIEVCDYLKTKQQSD